MEAKRRGAELFIAIPASLVSDIPHIRERTAAVGLVGRAAAIFRVGGIIIYRDPGSEKEEASFIRLILSYMETPQYIRRMLFPIRPELRYAGILPPLRTPHHPTRSKVEELRIGEFREGVILDLGEEGFTVDIGVEDPLIAEGRPPSPGSRVTVKVLETKPQLRGRTARRREIEEYWGYKVQMARGLGKTLSRSRFDLSIATSRRGRSLLGVIDPIREKWASAGEILIAFGSPRMGLVEILEHEGLSLGESFDFTVNTIPHQGSETIRTEEAIYGTLTAFNLLIEG